MAAQQGLAIMMGWYGVWEAAQTTEKGGATEGIATLTRIPILITKGTGVYSRKWHRVTLQYTRTRKIHLVSLYGYMKTKQGAAQPNRR